MASITVWIYYKEKSYVNLRLFISRKYTVLILHLTKIFSISIIQNGCQSFMAYPPLKGYCHTCYINLLL